MRIGIDLGGTKIEIIALDESGTPLARHRMPTPQGDYRATLDAIAALVHKVARQGSSLVLTHFRSKRIHQAAAG